MSRRAIAAAAILAVGIAGSLVRNIECLGIDNSAQLALVGRAESLVRPSELYFDGVGMLPDRAEPSTLWLDRHAVLLTLSEGTRSDAWHLFAERPPKLVIWSYRMEAIMPVVGPLIRQSYVQVAPNIRVAGVRLRAGQPTRFNVPVAGDYALYDESGRPLHGELEIDGSLVRTPVRLPSAPVTLTLRGGASVALLLPRGAYLGKFAGGRDNPALFAGVYD